MATTPETTRDKTIAELLTIRSSAASDLAMMPAAKEGSEWARDRYNDVAYCNRQLERLGVSMVEAAVLAAEQMTAAHEAWEEGF
jgi:hypothetical protein